MPLRDRSLPDVEPLGTHPLRPALCRERRVGSEQQHSILWGPCSTSPFLETGGEGAASSLLFCFVVLRGLMYVELRGKPAEDKPDHVGSIVWHYGCWNLRPEEGPANRVNSRLIIAASCDHPTVAVSTMTQSADSQEHSWFRRASRATYESLSKTS